MSLFRVAVPFCVLASILVSIATVPARAADLWGPTSSSTKDAPYVAPFSWTGLYLGANAGWTFGNADDTYDVGTPAATTFGINADGFSGGLHGGYNIQTGNLVVGIEGDFSWTDADGTKFCSNAVCLGTGTRPTLEINSIWSVRGRIGYAAGPTLWFATAGLAYADVDVRDPVQGGSDGKTHRGFIVGGGLERAINPNLRLRAEYLYANFEDKDYALVTTPDRFDLDTHTVRVGVSWSFGQ